MNKVIDIGTWLQEKTIFTSQCVMCKNQGHCKKHYDEDIKERINYYNECSKYRDRYEIR